jgi:hypothetical protein
MPAASLPADAPIRQVALLHSALAGERIGDMEAARALAASGLSVEECSLFDTHPIQTSTGTPQFPQDAERWQFEGYAAEGYDIDADGHPAGVRTVIAYPPFIFSTAAAEAARHFHYVLPKIGDKPAGCVGEQKGFSYRLRR